MGCVPQLIQVGVSCHSWKKQQLLLPVKEFYSQPVNGGLEYHLLPATGTYSN